MNNVLTPRFNLLDEPWICVLDKNSLSHTVSLRDALVNAHEYVKLNGELSVQSITILRWQLAVLHAIFSRCDSKGSKKPLQEESEAIDRWEELWQAEKFPTKLIDEYLSEYHERFWLIHPERPFLQILPTNIPANRKPIKAGKMNGQVSESDNKARLFANCAGEAKNSLSAAEAIRWLLYVNAIEDNAPKLGTGVGWLGQFGIITARGNNLFETLMLNLVLWFDQKSPKAVERPLWEESTVRVAGKHEISAPDNIAQLYTLPSRALCLNWNETEDRVLGYWTLAADYFNSENALIEPMSAWRRDKPKKNGPLEPWRPRFHSNSKALWRDFAAMFTELSEERSQLTREAGVVKWLRALVDAEKLDDYPIEFSTIQVEYGDAMRMSVANVSNESLAFSTDLLANSNLSWRQKIVEEVQLCDDVADTLAKLALDIYRAESGDDLAGYSCPACQHAKENFYFEVDGVFRRWILTLNTRSRKIDNSCTEQLHNDIQRLAITLAEEMANQASIAAFIGRDIAKKDQDKKTHYSTPLAKRYFDISLNKIFGHRGGGNNGK